MTEEDKLALLLGGASIPRFSKIKYGQQSGVVKQFNELMIEGLGNQVLNCQQLLREQEMVLKERTQELVEKDTQLQLIKQELGYVKGTPVIQFLLGVISTIVSGVGVNLVTVNASAELCWIMIVISIILQILSLMVNHREGSRKGV